MPYHSSQLSGFFLEYVRYSRDGSAYASGQCNAILEVHDELIIRNELYMVDSLTYGYGATPNLTWTAQLVRELFPVEMSNPVSKTDELLTVASMAKILEDNET